MNLKSYNFPPTALTHNECPKASANNYIQNYPIPKSLDLNPKPLPRHPVPLKP